MRRFIGLVLAGLMALTSAAYADGTSGSNIASPDINGEEEVTTAFFNSRNAIKKANTSYPEWFRGKGKDGLADENSLYWHTALISPEKNSEETLVAKNLNLGMLQLKPGVTYPAHNHPANELYLVLSGFADWYVNDEQQHVTAGSVIKHRPYDVHGWINTSTAEPLTVIWLWWLEGDNTSDIFNHSARFTNPDLSVIKNKVKPHAVPLPKTYVADQRVAQAYPGEYPVFGRLEGNTAFFHERDAEKKSIEIDSEGGNSSHWYRNLVTPEKIAEGNPQAENLYIGTLELEAGATYPIHEHAGVEVYLVVDGEADWYVNEEKKHVKAGTVIRHRPNSVHSITNTHKNRRLRVIRIGWLESDDDAGE